MDEAFENKYQIISRLETPQYRVFIRGYEIPIAKNVNIPTVCICTSIDCRKSGSKN